MVPSTKTFVYASESNSAISCETILQYKIQTKKIVLITRAEHLIISKTSLRCVLCSGSYVNSDHLSAKKWIIKKKAENPCWMIVFHEKIMPFFLCNYSLVKITNKLLFPKLNNNYYDTMTLFSYVNAMKASVKINTCQRHHRYHRSALCWAQLSQAHQKI